MTAFAINFGDHKHGQVEWNGDALSFERQHNGRRGTGVKVYRVWAPNAEAAEVKFNMLCKRDGFALGSITNVRRVAA